MTDVLTLILIVEAAFAVTLAKRKNERLAELLVFFIFSAFLVAVDAVELASQVSGAPTQLFSTTAARKSGAELSSFAEEALAGAVKWSYYLSIANSIAIAAITALLAAKGGVAIAAVLAQNGINALLSLANALVAVLAVYRFVGQLLITLAEIAQLLRSLLPLAGLLIISRSTRKLGATILVVTISLSLAAPALVNSLTLHLMNQLEGVPESVSDVGAIHLKGFIRVPTVKIEPGNVTVKERLYPVPPGGVSVYVDRQGRLAARPLGHWYLERSSEYSLSGITYAGFWFPVGKVTFIPERNFQLRVVCEEASQNLIGCRVYAVNITGTEFTVELPEGTLALFYDTTSTAKGWGYWKAKGFFVLEGSESLGSPLPWYNVSGFLADHQLVAILHPEFCDYKEGNETLRVRLRTGDEVNITLKFIEVTAWLEGHFDFAALCKNGTPPVLRRGLSRLQAGEETFDVEPELSCEITFVEPSLPDARLFEARWFDQWALLINSTLPPSLSLGEVRFCLYGRQGIEAVKFDEKIFYSRALWPRSTVPKIVVRAKYRGGIVEPAVIGPAKSGFPPAEFNEVLPLLRGGSSCPIELKVSTFDLMNESAVMGLVFDENLEMLLDGRTYDILWRSATVILEHTGLLAQLAVFLLALALATTILASVAGGYGLLHLPTMKPLYSTFQALEQLGTGVFTLIKQTVTAIALKRGFQRVKEPSILVALDPAIEIRRSLERLRREVSYQRSRLRRIARDLVRTWIVYSGAHPLPALLRAASEALLKTSLRSVKLKVSYEERLRIALRDPLTRKLIVASDVLYAASLLLESRLGTLAPTIRYARHLAKGFRRLYPPKMSKRDLKKLKRPAFELEKTLASIARDILRGRNPSRGLSALQKLRERYPRLRLKLDRIFGGAIESAEEIANGVIALAATEGFARKEFFKLLEKYPAAALPTADRAAMGEATVKEAWKGAIAAALSQLSHAKGFSVDLGAVWLASLERGEPWRYLVFRIAGELTEGMEPWFCQKLQPGVKRLLVEMANTWIRGSSSLNFEAALKSDRVDEYNARFLRGYSDASRIGKSSDLRSAVEAIILSGDAYWIGYAVALSEQQGGAEVLAKAITELLVERRILSLENRALIRSVEDFLERAYRELANAIVSVEERLRLLEHYRPLPAPCDSVALATEVRAERGELVCRLSDLHQSLLSAVKTLEALLAECSNLKQRAYWIEFFGPCHCQETLERWRSAAIRALDEFVRLRKWVEDNLKLLGG